MNSATRLAALVLKAKKIPTLNVRNTLKPWHTLLEVSEQAGNLELTRKLSVYSSQVELLAERLQRCSPPVPPHLFTNQFDKLQNFLNPMRHDQPWQATRDLLSADVPLCLEWASFMIGPQESDIAPADLAALAEQIEALEATIAELHSASLKRLLFDQVALLRKSLTDYYATGIEPVEKAVDTVIGSMTRNRAEIEEARAAHPQDAGTLKAIGEKLGAICTGIEKGGKVASSASAIGSAVHKAIQWFF
ncbi:hypothetical protein [Achromobacter kerstersii]|jgi:hypothetical protein